MWGWIIGGIAALGVVGGAVWYEEKKAAANSGTNIPGSTYLGGNNAADNTVGSAQNPADADSTTAGG